MNKITKIFFLSVLSSVLCSCASFFDKDNTPQPAPLVQFTPEIPVHALWTIRPSSGVGKDYIKLIPAVTAADIFTADKNGTVSAIDKQTHKIRWRVNAGAALSAGPTAAEGLVIVGSKEGDIIALQQTNGQLAWKTTASSEIFAAPAVGNGVVLVKSIDGKLSAFAAADGHPLWHYQQTEPTLILHGASVPQISHDIVIAGFANGNLAKLTLDSGNLLWQNTLATPEGSFAIQRMIDIDADPIIMGDRVYAATYQGHLAALDLNSGQTLWVHDLSSYTGMVVDGDRIYVTDAKSDVWAFDKRNGTVIWRQIQLEARNLTAPVLMGNTIVVGDGEGYLHWLSKEDGRTLARVKVNKSGILAAPVVSDGLLYVVTKDGHVAAYAY